jgi:hypothetical protein
MKKIKRFNQFINESFFGKSEEFLSSFGSIISGSKTSSGYPSSRDSGTYLDPESPGTSPGKEEYSIPSQFSTSRNDEDQCQNNDCWTWFGKEKFWNGVNKINNKAVPKIEIDKTPDHFNITYNGPQSGFLLKHKFGGKGDTIHQLLNVLTLELNSYLETINAKPVLSNIKMDLKGNKLSVYVPLEKVQGVHYEIHRRGGLGHPGDFSDLTKFKSRRGYEEAIHKSGRLTEKFITFIK